MLLRHARRGLKTGAALLGLAYLLSACSLPRLEVRAVSAVDGRQLEAAGDDLYQRGKRHLEDGHLGFALQAFRGALAEDPRSVRVLNALAVSYDQLGRDDLATPYFERALQIDPASPQTLNNLGYAALRRGDLASAIAWFRRALDHGGTHPAIHANLQVAAASGAGAEARAQLAKVVDPAPQIRPAGWVERSSAMVQTIVTQPDPALIATAARLGVEPRLASYHRTMP
jgi:Flp pilus assembly protein TadD